MRDGRGARQKAEGKREKRQKLARAAESAWEWILWEKLFPLNSGPVIAVKLTHRLAGATVRLPKCPRTGGGFKRETKENSFGYPPDTDGYTRDAYVAYPDLLPITSHLRWRQAQRKVAATRGAEAHDAQMACLR